MVGVAFQMDGYTTAAELAGAIAFHALTSVIGSQLISRAPDKLTADVSAG